MSKSIFENEAKFYWPVFSRQKIVFVKGEGVFLYDEQGKRYLDFITGVGVTPLGHSNEEINSALYEQSKHLYTCSNLFYSYPQIRLAEKLSQYVGEGKWFFSNSGTESIEAAIKIARRYGQVSGKRKIVTLYGSFHGRTFGSMSATGQEKIKSGFGSMLPDFTHICPGDFEELERTVDEATSALIVEVIQGEKGVRMIEDNFLRYAYNLCKKVGALFIVDEVQTGLWRTGETFLAGQKRQMFPDVVAIAKGLANGLPIGGTWIKEELASLLKAGDHGSTYGGNALCTAVATKVLDIMERENYAERNLKNGRLFMQELFKNLHNNDKVKEIRGEGLMVAVEFSQPIAEALVSRLAERGLLASRCGDNTLRFLPPFIAKEEHFEEAALILGEALEEILG
ncbi:MAG: aminotransferase class III-fold pyridoxal phosphate-dependent enzyme [Actinobacteria bacterium]|nr:aminotransferase class III-fold pyridoxal phosphate-dependent enzyme [Actinomycetota bacterium]